MQTGVCVVLACRQSYAFSAAAASLISLCTSSWSRVLLLVMVVMTIWP